MMYEDDAQHPASLAPERSEYIYVDGDVFVDDQVVDDPVSNDDVAEQLGGYLFLEGSRLYKGVLIAVAVVIALLSFFIIAPMASSPENHRSTIESLDAKKDTVMMLIAASTATSAAVTLIPDDVGTPIAEKLVDLSSDFLIVLSAIYLEKYLLTIFGLAAFKIQTAVVEKSR